MLKTTYNIDYIDDILLVILEIFLEAFCFLIIPVLAIFINSEFNLGKNFKASNLFFCSIKRFIFLIAFLYLLFLILFTEVCFDILLILLIADFVLAIFEGGITCEIVSVNKIIHLFLAETTKEC